MTTKRIDNWEIFAAGEWAGSGGPSKWSESDLDQMVEAFEAVGKETKPYLKLGHSNDQKLLQEDGYPSAGWITSLRRVKDKLVATVEGIPSKIYDLISSRAYGRVSSEIYRNAEVGGKKYPTMLKAVALLGADTPAVGTLKDFIDLYASSMPAQEFGVNCETVILYAKEEKKMDEPKNMVTLEEFTVLGVELAKVREENAKLKGDVEKFSAEVKNLETIKAELATFKAEQESKELAAFEKEVDFTIDGYLKDGNITPAEADFYKAMGKKHREDFELYKKHIEGRKTSYSGEESDTGLTSVDETEDERMFSLANRIVAAGEKEGRVVTYRDAVIEASRTLKGGLE
jgi:hypothetical protein